MEKRKYSFWGQFKDPEFEEAYLKYSLPEIQERNRMGIFIGGLAFVVVGASDFLRIGFTQGALITTALRLLLFLFSLYIFAHWRKLKNIQNIYINSVVFASVIGVFLNVIVYILNPDGILDIIDLLTVPLSLLLVYVFLIVPSQYLFTTGIISSFIYIELIQNFDNINWITLYIIAVILLTLNFMGMYITRFLNVARRTEFIRLQEIEELNLNMIDEIEERKAIQDKLIFAYNEITESMRYANHLQMALMPDLKNLDKTVKDHFIIYKPCDIVSGDFYWVSTKGNKTVIAIADCTGHGIRAGFMSIVGIALLDDIVNNKRITNANEILNTLKTQIIKTLHQDDEDTSRHDGMDMSLIVIDKSKMEMQFAGAFNPILLIRDNQLVEYKGDRMPISYYFAAKPSFTNNIITLMPKDKVYMYTDGFADQFGGPNEKKFTYKRLKREIQAHSHESMELQREMLMNSHKTWRGKNPQTDDIIVFGFQI